MYQFLNTGNSFKAASSNVKHCEPTQYWEYCDLCLRTSVSHCLWHPYKHYLRYVRQEYKLGYQWSSLWRGNEGNWKSQNIHRSYGRAEDFRVDKPRLSYVNSHLFKKLLSSLSHNSSWNIGDTVLNLMTLKFNQNLFHVSLHFLKSLPLIKCTNLLL